MLDCNGKPTKFDLTQFISKSTGKSYESAHMDLFMPKLDKKAKFSHSFDYRDLIGQSKFNPLGKPTFNQVADFMVKETGCSPESALIKLCMPKFSNDVKIVGGVKMYPVKMMHCI